MIKLIKRLICRLFGHKGQAVLDIRCGSLYAMGICTRCGFETPWVKQDLP